MISFVMSVDDWCLQFWLNLLLFWIIVEEVVVYIVFVDKMGDGVFWKKFSLQLLEQWFVVVECDVLVCYGIVL